MTIAGRMDGATVSGKPPMTFIHRQHPLFTANIRYWV